jgi:hypothetical protein
MIPTKQEISNGSLNNEIIQTELPVSLSHGYTVKINLPENVPNHPLVIGFPAP